MKNDWGAGQLQELLGLRAAHPFTLAGGGNDRDVHALFNYRFAIGNADRSGSAAGLT